MSAQRRARIRARLKAMQIVLRKYPGVYANKTQGVWVIGNGDFGVLGYGYSQIDAWIMARDKIIAENFAEALTN